MEFSDFGIDIKSRKAGNIKTKCPQCGGKTDLSVNITEGIWKCHKPKCGWVGTLKTKALIKKEPYVKPEWINATSLDEKVVKWFKGRGISQQTLIQAKITCGIEYIPQVNTKRNVIKFNYFRNEELINCKCRDGEKNFKLVSGAELIFYNLDGIKDTSEIIIVEGEIDALAYMEADLMNVVSVPNGASKGSLKLEYLDNCWKYFEGEKKFYIAVDKDEAGFILQGELLRRLDINRCFDVDLKDCKDANEFLLKYGAEELSDTIKNARPFPLPDVEFAMDHKLEYDELYETGLQPGAGIGHEEIDKLITYEKGQFTVVTGIPSHGKSEFLDYVITRLLFIHNWRIAFFSPENHPLKLHLSKIAEKIIGKKFSGYDKMSPDEKDAALEYVNSRIFFIKPKSNFCLDNIMKISKSLILRYGINAVVIDPWNRLDHQYEGENETKYISREMDKILSFSQENNIHSFLVAHPVKMQRDKNTKVYEVPTLYNISGSAHFFNKCDNGVCVYRDFNEEVVRLYVQKIRFKNIGEQGTIDMIYNKTNGRYAPSGRFEDNENYLVMPISETKTQVSVNINSRIESDKEYPF